MSKSKKRQVRIIFDDDKDIHSPKKAGRHAKLNKPEVDDEYFEPEDMYAELAAEVEYFLKKK